MAPSLVLESIDAPESLSHKNIEDQVGEGEERDGDPTVAALEAGGLSLGHEDKAQENEEEKEELVELLFLEVNGPFFLQGFFKVELDDCV